MLTFLSAGLGWIALLAAPALLAVYFFRHRHRREEVSSLLFWQSVARVREGGRALKRTRLPWLFLVELLFLALCGLAATSPRWLRMENRRPLVVVVDDSASMGVLHGRHDRRAEALRVAYATARERRWRSVQFVLSGPEARRFGTWEALRPAWTTAAPSADLPSALRMAQELAGTEGQILVLTDHAPDDTDSPSSALRWVALGRSLENTAFVQAVRSPRDAESDYCLLGIETFGPQTRDVRLTIAWDHAPTEQIALALTPGAPHFRTVVAPPGAGVGRFRLESQDAMPLDDSVVLVPSPRPRVPVTIAIDDPLLAAPVRAALDASGFCVDSPPEVAALAIIDGTNTPSALPASAWQLRIIAPADARTLLGPFLRSNGHPLLEGMDLQGTAWGASSSVILTGEPLLRAGNTTLLAASDGARDSQSIELQLSATRSSLQRTPDWPVFFVNLLAWRWSHIPPGLESRNLRSGMPVTLRLPPDVDTVECRWNNTAQMSITAPDAAPSRRSAAKLPSVAWTPQQTGLHTLRWAGGDPLSIGVNFLSAEESDLRRGVAGEWGAWREADATGKTFQDVAWIVLLVALLVLQGHHAMLR